MADSSGTVVLRPSTSNVVGQGGLAQRVVPLELALYLILTTRSVLRRKSVLLVIV